MAQVPASSAAAVSSVAAPRAPRGTPSPPPTSPTEVLPRTRAHLLADTPSGAPGAARELAPHLAEPLAREGLLARGGLAVWSARALAVIRRLARDPFATQEEFARELSLTRPELVRLHRVLRHSTLAQRLIVAEGPAAKYWQNTLLPLGRAGVLEAALRGDVRFPFRVGLYPGLSCMFQCTFCGRHGRSRYRAGEAHGGNEVFRRLLDEAPEGDPHTFYLSGGLEPLSNPGLGDVVAAGAARGFALSLYTNGFALTPRLLAAQPGLWRLATLRISLYGVDARSAAAVTGRAWAFDGVVENLVSLLRLRAERGAPLRVGLNYVLQRGHADELGPLFELVAAVNREAGTGRNLDFLTLREDYGVGPEKALSPAERRRLAGALGRARARLDEPDLAGLRVDLGYALAPQARGVAVGTLARCRHEDLPPHAFPQVSVVVDVRGDVYAYREAGFVERPGAERYRIGSVAGGRPLLDLLAEFRESGRRFAARPGDVLFLDAFDHVVARCLAQARHDEAFGVPFDAGPVDRRGESGLAIPPLAHPTLPV